MASRESDNTRLSGEKQDLVHFKNDFNLSKPGPKLSKPYYFNKISYVLTELWMFFYMV